MKFLEDIIGVNLHDLGSGNGFLDMTPKAQAAKEKSKLDLNKIKNLCIKRQYWGTWVTKSVKHLTLGFGLGMISRFVSSSPTLGSTRHCGACLEFSLSLSPSLSLSLPYPCLCSFSLKTNKINFKKNVKRHHQEVKRQPTKWEKIFVRSISDESSIQTT